MHLIKRVQKNNTPYKASLQEKFTLLSTIRSMSFAENLKELLDSKEIEVKELAHGTGISKNTLDNYLSGQKSIPNAENAVKIAKFLGTTVEYLITGTFVETSPSQEISKIVKNLYRLNKSDFESIKNIITSLAQK